MLTPSNGHHVYRVGGLTVGSDETGVWAASTRSSAERERRVPLLALEIYDRAQLRSERIERLSVDRLEQVGDAVHVMVSDRSRLVAVALWVRPLPDGGFSVTVSPAEVYESRTELYQLFSIDLLPGFMRCGPDGVMLLPINIGVLCRPAGKPARSDRFLIYGEQQRWELLPTMPVCAFQSPGGGMLALAAGGAAETEVRVSTDGTGHGTVGMGFFWRAYDVSPVEQEIRTIRFHPIPADQDVTEFAARVLRKHITEELGKPTLEQRARECPDVANLLKSYIMKLFYGMQAQGQMMGESSSSGGMPRFLLTMTFAEADQALSSLHDAGVEHIYTQNVGWNYRGHDGAYPTRFPVEERVGGEAGFRALLAARHAAGDTMTVHDNYIDAYVASPDFDPDVVTCDPYGKHQIRGFWAGGASYLYWPSAFGTRHLDEQMSRVASMGVRGPYYLDGMGSPLYANHHSRHRGSRSEMARGIDRLLRVARNTFGSSATESGFLYCSLTPDLVANPGGQHLVGLCKPEWPITAMFDEIVPLWQLTMTGLVVTENQGLGWEDTMQAMLLNQHPRCEWSTRPGVQAVLDEPMIEKIAARYNLLIKRFGHLRTQQLTGYTRDADGIQHSTYEDGTRVSVDAARSELIVNDERIEKPAAYAEPVRQTSAAGV